MGLQIKTPQAFVYVAKIPAAKKIKGIVFKRDVPVSVHDPKVIRLLARLPYMRQAEDAAVPAPKPKADGPLDIPQDWQKAHWKRRMAWARAIAGAEMTTPSEANRVIAEHRGETVAAQTEAA
jgi:hypothetical protein